MNIETITSAQNARFKQAMRLHSSRGRKQQNRIIIFGRREIERAIDSGVQVVEIFAADTQSLQQLPSIPAAADCLQLDPDLMAQLQFGDRSDGIVAIANRPKTDLPAFPSDLKTLIVLEQVEKPGNIGAIVRSIDAVGNCGMLLADPRCDAFHPNAIRASTGAVFDLPVATASNVDTQAWLAENGYQVMTCYLEEAVDFFNQDLSGPIALVLGNEANGLSGQWRQKDFQPVKLPMNGTADSLNVSVTASVMLYESLRQRRK
jgi:TrmH family RNA methyltransferase